MRLIYVVMLVGCGRESSRPDAFVTTQYVGIQGNTAAVHATTQPAGIDCGPTTAQCSHMFVARSLVHLHIEQVDTTCGTVTLEQQVGDGSGGTFSVPYDLTFGATDMVFTVTCAP